jgi:hypothetical protein
MNSDRENKNLLHIFYTQILSLVVMLEAMDASAQIPPDLSRWIDQHISRPIRGFEHKKKANGNEYSFSEQILATRHQVRLIAYSYLKCGKSEEEIRTRLKWFV